MRRCSHDANASSQERISAPSFLSSSSTSLSMSTADFEAVSYVECAPFKRVTLKPALRAPLEVDTTQHSLCMPKVTISVIPSALSSPARAGFDSKVSPVCICLSINSSPALSGLGYKAAKGMAHASSSPPKPPLRRPGAARRPAATAPCPSIASRPPASPRAGRTR